jgi:translation initiation factor IF-3
LVGPNGEQVGIVRVEDALRLAAEADLDLVEVAPNARPPVCKLMDFGKFKYESAMKAREARRNQTNTVIKEIKLRPKIDPHDYGTKKGHVERFLKAGDKVKVTIMFRGREQSRPELGFRLLQRLAEDIGELGFVESTPKQDGRNMIMVIGPTRKKADAKAEERRRREQTSRGPVDAPVDAPAEAPAPTAVETVTEVPVEAVTEAPVQAPAEAPAEAAAEAPAEAPAEALAASGPKPSAPAAKKAPAKKAATKTAAGKTAASKTAASKTAATGTTKTATKKPAGKTAAKIAEPAADAS